MVTASAAGIYPFVQCPQYGMAKHGLVGLVRSLAPRAREVGVAINAVCPALVRTALAPKGLLDSFKVRICSLHDGTVVEESETS